MALVVASKVKALIKKSKMATAGDFVGGLEKEIERIVESAIRRAKANKRKTVRAADL
jgi:histone H3/H4